jgi:hypothetical protein
MYNAKNLAVFYDRYSREGDSVYGQIGFFKDAIGYFL